MKDIDPKVESIGLGELGRVGPDMPGMNYLAAIKEEHWALCYQVYGPDPYADEWMEAYTRWGLPVEATENLAMVVTHDGWYEIFDDTAFEYPPYSMWWYTMYGGGSLEFRATAKWRIGVCTAGGQSYVYPARPYANGVCLANTGLRALEECDSWVSPDVPGLCYLETFPRGYWSEAYRELSYAPTVSVWWKKYVKDGLGLGECAGLEVEQVGTKQLHFRRGIAATVAFETFALGVKKSLAEENPFANVVVAGDKDGVALIAQELAMLYGRGVDLRKKASVVYVIGQEDSPFAEKVELKPRGTGLSSFECGKSVVHSDGMQSHSVCLDTGAEHVLLVFPPGTYVGTDGLRIGSETQPLCLVARQQVRITVATKVAVDQSIISRELGGAAWSSTLSKFAVPGPVGWCVHVSGVVASMNYWMNTSDYRLAKDRAVYAIHPGKGDASPVPWIKLHDPLDDWVAIGFRRAEFDVKRGIHKVRLKEAGWRELAVLEKFRVSSKACLLVGDAVISDDKAVLALLSSGNVCVGIQAGQETSVSFRLVCVEDDYCYDNGGYSSDEF